MRMRTCCFCGMLFDAKHGGCSCGHVPVHLGDGLRCCYGLMEPDRPGDWMETYTGRRIFLLDPRPEDISIVDIAHGLAGMPRFAAQSRVVYSVACHSLMVADMVVAAGRPDLALVALLHDAPEAYLLDVPKPLKVALPFYKALERRFAVAIGRALGLGNALAELDPEIKRHDLAALSVERRDLIPHRLPWTSLKGEPPPSPRHKAKPLSQNRGRRAFLRRYNELAGLVRDCRGALALRCLRGAFGSHE